MGFAQTYGWTKDPVFLQAAIRLADYFLQRLEEAKHEFKMVPKWDFDAPTAAGEEVLRDTSAGMIAANGMLLIHQFVQMNPELAPKKRSYLNTALEIVSQTIKLSLGDKAAFVRGEMKEAKLSVEDVQIGGRWDAILKNATANYNEDAHKRYWDHGLVYADYYFLEFGNKLARMGLV